MCCRGHVGSGGDRGGVCVVGGMLVQGVTEVVQGVCVVGGRGHVGSGGVLVQGVTEVGRVLRCRGRAGSGGDRGSWCVL